MGLPFGICRDADLHKLLAAALGSDLEDLPEIAAQGLLDDAHTVTRDGPSHASTAMLPGREVGIRYGRGGPGGP
ncbi:MAG: hypothetical protein AABX97_06875 [Candidatus Thermoplasmatota archaeon]